MANLITLFVPVVAAYFLGSLSFSYLIVRVLKGVDIRTVGSGNAGATNVLRVCGKGPAVVALVLDIGKGAAAVLAARALALPVEVVGAVGAAAVFGHVFPVFFGFRGGKGVATAAGTLGSLMPWATAIAVGLFVLVVFLTRYVSLGSVVAAASYPLIVFLGYTRGWIAPGHLPALLVSSGLIAGLVVVKHRANLRRLLSGQESKLGRKAVVAPANEEPKLEPRTGINKQ